MPSPFPCSPVIRECSWKKTQLGKKKTPAAIFRAYGTSAFCRAINRCAQIFFCVIPWHLHSTKPELRFCASSNLARGGSEIWDGEDYCQWSRLEIKLNAFCRPTIPQKQFNIIITSEVCNIATALNVNLPTWLFWTNDELNRFLFNDYVLFKVYW